MNFDRSQAAEIAKQKSARADMMQHSKKLIQGFENLDDSHARRAIWELVQNACDLSKNCEIIIDFSNNGVSFSHNGKPFTSETLISLIKQVSSKSTENKDEVGQFGTGFITTHSFGKKFTINSSLKEGDFYISIDDFLIDRQAKNEDQLLEKLAEQEKEVFRLISEGEVSSEPKPYTVFRYLPETDSAKNNIEQAALNLHHYIPLVLTLNSSLISVTVINLDGTKVFYQKGDAVIENKIIKTPILKNGSSINTFSLKSDDENIQIILPLTDNTESIKFTDSTAKLFLFFPLIGSEHWGCNFIIHSKMFGPTEPRDGLHLKSKNEQIQEKEEANRQIIVTASEMIFEFIEQNANLISEPINLAFISFDTSTNAELLNTYYRELKQTWVDCIKNVDLIETDSCRKSPAETVFISKEFLRNEKYYDSIYQLLAFFWEDQLPKMSIAREWTNIISNWEDKSIELVTIEMLVQKIEDQHSVTAFDENILITFYQYLLEIGRGDIFNHYKLLPNIKEQFVQKETIVKPINISQEFISIADIIATTIPLKFIKKNYELGIEYPEFKREHLSKEFNAQIIALQKNLTPENLFSESFRNALISLCSIYAAENTTSARRKVMPLICQYYELEYKEVIIPNIEEDKIDYDYTPFRGLVKNFLLDIVNKSNEDINWVKNNIDFLKACLEILARHKDLEGIVDLTPVFPNQNYELCLQSELTKETLFPTNSDDSEFLKEIFEEIIDDVKGKLVLNDFAEIISHHNFKAGQDLSSQLELKFKENPFDPINEHPHKKVIFQIIQKITNNGEWARLFSDLNSNKALIMMSKISDDDVKNDLFSIIGLEDKDKIAALGALSKNPDLERIIELGKKAVEEKQRENADFAFKKYIGVHIEDLVRNKIGEELEGFEIRVYEQQDGQDMVAYLNGEIVYYIEVKSRWDKNSTIKMSYKQIKKSAANKENYALCSVDMCDYFPEDGNRYEVPEISKISDRIKFLPDIGVRIDGLISKVISVEGKEDEVYLTDEYRANVPQAVVSKGMGMDSFVDFLTNHLGFSSPFELTNTLVNEVVNN